MKKIKEILSRIKRTTEATDFMIDTVNEEYKDNENTKYVLRAYLVLLERSIEEIKEITK